MMLHKFVDHMFTSRIMSAIRMFLPQEKACSGAARVVKCVNDCAGNLCKEQRHRPGRTFPSVWKKDMSGDVVWKIKSSTEKGERDQDCIFPA